jgi:hypothetical protein
MGIIINYGSDSGSNCDEYGKRLLLELLLPQQKKQLVKYLISFLFG